MLAPCCFDSDTAAEPPEQSGQLESTPISGLAAVKATASHRRPCGEAGADGDGTSSSNADVPTAACSTLATSLQPSDISTATSSTLRLQQTRPQAHEFGQDRISIVLTAGAPEGLREEIQETRRNASLHFIRSPSTRRGRSSQLHVEAHLPSDSVAQSAPVQFDSFLRVPGDNASRQGNGCRLGSNKT